MNIEDFPKNPYPGQVYWDMKSKIVFEYWTPDEEFPTEVKPKWITKSFEAECIAMLFSKKGKEKYFAYNKLIDIYKYTDQQIKDLMKEMRME
tara:strand:+ start:17312 stop:17587 length:276 start_codon:yes stop_codon:yes gene_type:complete